MNTLFKQYQQEHAHILTFFKFYDMNELDQHNNKLNDKNINKLL